MYETGRRGLFCVVMAWNHRLSQITFYTNSLSDVRDMIKMMAPSRVCLFIEGTGEDWYWFANPAEHLAA
jgi:hypothetical protein